MRKCDLVRERELFRGDRSLHRTLHRTLQLNLTLAAAALALAGADDLAAAALAAETV